MRRGRDEFFIRVKRAAAASAAMSDCRHEDSIFFPPCREFSKI